MGKKETQIMIQCLLSKPDIQFMIKYLLSQCYIIYYIIFAFAIPNHHRILI